MVIDIHAVLAAIALSAAAAPSFAVEGGAVAYLLGSRGSFAEIVPGPGPCAGVEIMFSEGAVKGLSRGGLPIRAESDLSVAFAKLSLTQVFDAEILGGTPACNVNIPYAFNAELLFIGETPPIAGLPISDATSGIGDIMLTSLVGWHDGNLH